MTTWSLSRRVTIYCNNNHTGVMVTPINQPVKCGDAVIPKNTGTAQGELDIQNVCSGDYILGLSSYPRCQWILDLGNV